MTHSGHAVEPQVMRIAAVAIASLLATAAVAEQTHVTGGPEIVATPAVAPPVEPPRSHGEVRWPPHGRTCFSQTETREKIAQRRLADPIGAMRAGRAEGEALRTRLCRWTPDELVYEVLVLRHDGHVVHLYMNAQSGRTVSAPSDHK